jgi:hypothetical protein
MKFKMLVLQLRRLEDQRHLLRNPIRTLVASLMSSEKRLKKLI